MSNDASSPADLTSSKHFVLENPGETRLMSHLPQLDGVRAIAVLLVVFHHLFPWQTIWKPIRQGKEIITEVHFPFSLLGPDKIGFFGAMGVGLFFVLSGFLITRILLGCKSKIDSHRTSLGQTIKQFYIRRFLRIFPLFYGTIAVLWVLDARGFRERVWWHVSYLSNYYFSFVNTTRTPGEVPYERHFWSLAVEEQFYIFWPILILVVPRRFLKWMIVAVILSAPISRAILQITVRPYIKYSNSHEWMLPACLDLLGIGALLALLTYVPFSGPTIGRKFVNILGWIGVPLWIVWLLFNRTGHPLDAMKFPGGHYFYGGTTYVVTALAGCWLVGRAAFGFKGWFGKVLTLPPLVYTGRISYGLYVLHPFVARITETLDGKYHWQLNIWISFLISLAGSYALATASWFLFEGPLNSLKRYFEYDAKSKSTLVTGA